MNTPNYTLPRHLRGRLLENCSLRQSIHQESHSNKSWNKSTKKKTWKKKRFYPLHLSSTKCIQECLTTTIRQQRKTDWLELHRHQVDNVAACRQIKDITTDPHQHNHQALLIEDTHLRWSLALSSYLRESLQPLLSTQRSMPINNGRTFPLQC